MEQEGEMTATNRLRALLDERGVEWMANDGEHGTWMHCVEGSDGKPFGGTEKWVQDIPCKCNLKDGKGWFALDYEPADSVL